MLKRSSMWAVRFLWDFTVSVGSEVKKSCAAALAALIFAVIMAYFALRNLEQLKDLFG